MSTGPKRPLYQNFRAEALVQRPPATPFQFLQLLIDSRLELFGIEEHWPATAGVTDSAVLADEVKAIGVALVVAAYFVIHFVDDRRHGEFQISDAGGGGGRAFPFGDGIFDERALEIGARTVDGVRFANVDNEEFDVGTVLFINLSQPTG